MPSPLVFSDGQHVEDAGHCINSLYVDFRDPTDRVPIRSLIKGCRQEHAFELCNVIRISKPMRFREFGDQLVKDEREANPHHETLVSERTNHPSDLLEAQQLDAECNRASELVGSNRRLETTSTKVLESRFSSLTFGKNGWIFCVSIKPKNQLEERRWQESLPDDYDHVSNIYRPRAFARALASMVADQLGPQGAEGTMNHSFEGTGKFQTNHRVQMIFHGPVIYACDPYSLITNAASKAEFMLLPIFTKGIKYKDQREYRFAIWSDQEPLYEVVDLDVSPSMLGSMQAHSTAAGQHYFPTIVPLDRDIAAQTPLDESSIQDDGELRLDVPISLPQEGPTSSFIGRLDDPSIPVAPTRYDILDPPGDLHEVTTTYSSLKALRYSVERLPKNRHIEAASSAWHIEPCIRRLCSAFEDPIENFRISDDNFVVVTFKFSDLTGAEATLSVGPMGAGAFQLKTGRKKIEVTFREAGWIGTGIIEYLEEYSFRPRQQSIEPTPIDEDESIETSLE